MVYTLTLALPNRLNPWRFAATARSARRHGGIAAYKAAELVRLFVKDGTEVQW